MGIDNIIFFLTSVPIWATMAPIFVCSIISLAVIIERIVFYRKINFDYRFIMDNVTNFIDMNNLKKANSFLDEYHGPVITVIREILNSFKTKSDRQLTILASSRYAIVSVERYVAVIATIATISPMLGLLGTVTGLLKGFTALYRMGAGTEATHLLALGVSETLITTVLGLLVAIPSWSFYNFMVAKVEHYVKEIEYISNIFMKI
jgi:biopolymer transport protein ExbB